MAPYDGEGRMGSKVVIGVILVVVAAGLMWLLWGSLAAPGDELAVPVRQGKFVVCVQVKGRLESGNAARVEVRPRGNILTFLAPEGVVVKKDEVLARFDDTNLRERVINNEADLKMAEVRRAVSVQAMAVRKQEIAAQITMFEADLAIRRTQYERLKSLPRPDEVTRSRLERDYRKSCMEIARQDYEIVQTLSGRGTMIFSKEDEREKELALTEAKGELEKAENALKQLMEGAPPATLEAAQRELAKAGIGLVDAKGRMPEQITILEAGVRSAEAEVDKMQARLEQTQKDLDRLEVKSPGEGMLVYRTVDGRALELGGQYWGVVHLFDIADPDNMVIRAKVSEAEFSRIRVGQAVEIHAFCVSDRVFAGEVKEVAKVARDKSEGQLRRSNFSKAGIQTFDVLVKVMEKHPYLRPNIEADVVICCESLPDALCIPIDAVFEQDGRKWVRVLGGLRPKLREVTLGVYANDWVQVTKGLAAGEKVLLKPPEREGS